MPIKIYVHALMNEDADYHEAIPAFLPPERVNSGGAGKLHVGGMLLWRLCVKWH